MEVVYPPYVETLMVKVPANGATTYVYTDVVRQLSRIITECGQVLYEILGPVNPSLGHERQVSSAEPMVYFPPGHHRHPWIAPVVGVNCPAGHRRQFPHNVGFLNFPSAHDVPEPCALHAEPPGQFLQILEPILPAYFPVEH